MVADPNEAEPADVPRASEIPEDNATDFPSEVESEIAQLVAGELEQIASDTGGPASPDPMAESPPSPPVVSPLDQGGIKGGPDAEPEAVTLPPPPPPPPKKALPQPKIDFAALRRAKTADATNAKASVSRMFGDKSAPGDAEPPSVTPDSPASDPGQAILEASGVAGDGVAAMGQGRVRAVRERVRIAVEWVGRQDPELLRILGMIGLFFLFNGTLIFVLALFGWI